MIRENRDGSRIRGQVSATVFSLDAVGLRKLDALRQSFGDPAPGINTKSEVIREIRETYRKSPEYREAYKAIYAEHGFKKRRVTRNLKVFTTMFKSAMLRRWQEVRDLWRYECAINHNIVTDEGDAMVADIMSQTPARAKVDGTNGHIDVGTGWTGTTPKANTGVNTPTGSPEVMDATYPKQKGAFGAANDNVTQYRSTYEAGDLNATGINEAAILNNATRGSADCLAYGQITPSVNVGTSDTLQVDWEITYLGA